MNAIRHTCTILLAATVLLAPDALAQKKNPIDEISSADGLTKVEVKGIDLSYRREGVSMAPYNKLIVEPVEVAFHKNWDPTRPGSNLKLGKADRENIRSGVGKIVQEEFEKALKAGGTWQLVKEAGPDVLRLKPKVLNLYVNAPDTKQPGVRTYTVSSGEMTLLLELYDSETGAILARAVDRQESRDTGMWQISSTVTNVADAQQIAARWAKVLRDRLDKAKGATK